MASETRYDRLRDGSAWERRWRAYHLHYHEDPDRLVRELVAPLVRQLSARGMIDRFYFVHYELGGPHVRLRLRLAESTPPDAAEAVLAGRIAEYFERRPSTRPVSPDRIRNTNRRLLGTDPLAREHVNDVVPDNSWHAAPPGFEIERYGGPDRIEASLHLFTLTSVYALEAIQRAADTTSSASAIRRGFLRIAVHMAWGLSADEASLIELLEYAPRLMGAEPFAACLAEADAAFERRPRELAALVRHELVSGISPDGLAGACARLAPEIAALDPRRRWHLAASHIHMTANRLGLTNADEIQLSRIAWHAANHLRTIDEYGWRTLWSGRSSFDDLAMSRSLDTRATAVMAAFAESLTHI